MNFKHFATFGALSVTFSEVRTRWEKLKMCHPSSRMDYGVPDRDCSGNAPGPADSHSVTWKMALRQKDKNSRISFEICSRLTIKNLLFHIRNEADTAANAAVVVVIRDGIAGIAGIGVHVVRVDAAV